jgi:heat shock protein HtpX
MNWPKRILFFLLTNIAVIAVLSITFSVLNIAPYLTEAGLDYQSLLIFASIIGFTGSIVSLLLSKWMAKNAFGVKIITRAQTDEEQFLFHTVERLAAQLKIGMPEVGIYESPEANAFATGWNKNSALVAVSSGLMHNMTHDELEGVIGHEMAHVANGDMVTLALIQGIVNTFVIFFARIAAYAVQTFLSRDDENGMGTLAYHLTAIVFEILFGILASVIVMYFSRYREFRADAGSADLVGHERMTMALQKLQVLSQTLVDPRGKSFSTMKISDRPSRFMAIFSSHPPIEERLAALKNYRG